MQIKGHKKIKEKRRGEPWPRKYIAKHTENKCPYCKKHIKNIEGHIKVKHRDEKPKLIEGKVHGHD